MSRANKRRIYEAPLNVDIPVDLRQALDDFCEKRYVKIKNVVETALRRFIAAETESVGKRK